MKPYRFGMHMCEWSAALKSSVFPWVGRLCCPGRGAHTWCGVAARWLLGLLGYVFGTATLYAQQSFPVTDTFAQIFQEHPAIMLLIEPDSGEIVAANPAAVEFYGYSADAFLDLNIDQINLFDATQVAAERMLAREQQRQFFRFRHRLADGSVAPVNVYSAPVGANNGLLLSIVHPAEAGTFYQEQFKHYQQQLEEQVDRFEGELQQAHTNTTIALVVGALVALALLLGLLARQRRLQQTRKQLATREQFLQTLLNLPADCAVITVNYDGVIDYFSPGAEQMFGYAADEVEGRRTALLLHREADLERWFEQHAGVKDNRQARRTFWSQLLKSHEIRSEWILVDAKGQPLQAVVAVGDYPHPSRHDAGCMVVMHLRSRSDQQANSDGFNPNTISMLAADKAGVGTWSLEVKTGRMYWNASLFTKLGLQANAVEPSYSFLRQALHPADRELFEQAVEQATHWNEPLVCESRVQDQHGQIKWMKFIGEPVGDVSNRTEQLVGVVLDVGEERNLRAQLQEREALFRALYEQSPVSIMIHDPETGRCLDANPAAIKAYGLNSLDDLMQVDAWLDAPYSLEDAQKAIRHAGQFGATEVEWCSKTIDGDLFYEWVYLHPIAFKNQRRVISIGIDTTSRIKAEQALQSEADKLRERVRELNCLHQLAELFAQPLTYAERLAQIVSVVEQGMQHPEQARGWLRYQSENVGDAEVKQWPVQIQADLIDQGQVVGALVVGYPKAQGAQRPMVFLDEEKQLLRTVAAYLTAVLKKQ